MDHMVGTHHEVPPGKAETTVGPDVHSTDGKGEGAWPYCKISVPKNLKWVLIVTVKQKVESLRWGSTKWQLIWASRMLQINDAVRLWPDARAKARFRARPLIPGESTGPTVDLKLSGPIKILLEEGPEARCSPDELLRHLIESAKRNSSRLRGIEPAGTEVPAGPMQVIGARG
jgi:hypothetical protein